MKYQPYFHAISAIAYIGAVALFMNYIESIRRDTPDTIIDGLGFISLFVTSVATMAFLFFYQPLILLLENKKAEALTFFFKTLSTFAAITVVILAATSLQ
jgi:hypothetical protein